MKAKSGVHIIEDAVRQFEYVAGNVASHNNVRDENIYPQPSTYLTTHYICMKVAGFNEVDFDTLTAVSGASALFSYFPQDFMPKYAHMHIGISKRIEQATGFGWEWLTPRSPEECFEIIKDSNDTGKPVQASYYEDILFAGYGAKDGKRKVYVMTDGAEYFIHWFNWKTFTKWFNDWGDSGIGRYAGQKSTLPGKEIASRFIKDLIHWSVKPPQKVIDEYPGAKFGLEGIEQYANDCADIGKFSDWRACHDINPQWITRKSTAKFLKRIAEEQLLNPELEQCLLRSSELYYEAYHSWREFYNLLGHVAPKKNGTNKRVRLKGSEAVKKALSFESEALAEISTGLKKCDFSAG